MAEAAASSHSPYARVHVERRLPSGVRSFHTNPRPSRKDDTACFAPARSSTEPLHSLHRSRACSASGLGTQHQEKPRSRAEMSLSSAFASTASFFWRLCFWERASVVTAATPQSCPSSRSPRHRSNFVGPDSYANSVLPVVCAPAQLSTSAAPGQSISRPSADSPVTLSSVAIVIERACTSMAAKLS